MPEQPYLLAEGLTYELPSVRTLFRNVQASVFALERIALVGANGVGKSTLLQIFARQIRPTAGSVKQCGSIYYLPQVSTIVEQIMHQTVLEFLNAISEEWWTIWELTPNGLDVYGGNFSAYREQKQTALEAKWRSHLFARKELKQAKASAMQEQQRAAQSQRNGRLHADSIPRITAGIYKRKAEVTAGKLKQKHEIAIANATQKVEQTKVKTTKVANIQLSQRSHKNRHLVEIQNANLWVNQQLLIENIDFHLKAGERVAISGANGSGKSSLVKAILNRSLQAILNHGEVLLSPSMRAVYLDQNYEFVARNLTLVENMQAVNPALSYQLVRQQLGHFLFFNQTVDQLASVLSGGELARLALAMISCSDLQS